MGYPGHMVPIPKAGDMTVCFYCQAILQWGPTMALCRVLADDFLELPIETQAQLVHTKHSIKSFRKQKGLN